MSRVQTNNSYLQDKIDLRIAFLPKKNNINVLDLFSGSQNIWRSISAITGKTINIISIDIKKETGRFHIIGDNIKYLMNMHIDKYDIIDIDAYGIPFDHIDNILSRNFSGELFITFIKDKRGRLPNSMLEKLGYTPNMYKKCPTLFSKNAIDKLKNALTKYGITNIDYIAHNNKYYIHIGAQQCKQSMSHQEKQESIPH